MANNQSVSTGRDSKTIIIGVLLALLALLVLLMPPISLWERLSGNANRQPVPAAGATLTTADGAAISLLAGQPAQATLESQPAADFEGDLPPGQPLGPLYRLTYEGDAQRPVQVSLPAPANADHVDLFVQNGQGDWTWQPSRRSSDGRTLTARLEAVPQAVALLAPPETTEVELWAETVQPDNLPDDLPLQTLSSPGVRVQADGSLTGEPQPIPDGYTGLALVRNWTDNNPPVTAFLVDADAREQHLADLAALAEDYDGLELDYRGLDSTLRDDLSAFVADLRQALPAEAQLALQVSTVQAIPGGWQTGPFDLAALGPNVNLIKLSVPPLINQTDSDVESRLAELLTWATAQVERSKLALLVRTGSSLWQGGAVRDIATLESLAEQIGPVTVVEGGPEVTPGQSLAFALGQAAGATGFRQDEASGRYWLAYIDAENRHHTLYLGHLSDIGPALAQARTFGLNGVAIQHQPEDGALVWPAVAAALEAESPPADYEYSLTWRVQDESGEVVAEATAPLQAADYRWTAPEEGGEFDVAARLVTGDDDDDDQPVGRSLEVNVSTPTPTPSPSPTPTRTPRPTRTPTPEASPTPTPAPTQPPAAAPPAAAAPPPAAPPPAVASVNVPFGYGIQADPRGNTAANIGSIQALGFNWVKFQMAWEDVESAPKDYSWAMWDQLIDAYHNNGIRILLSIPKAPDWARPIDDDKSVEGPPQDPALFAEFLAIVADRYRGRVQMIEVWNEQNLWYEAGGAGRINPAKYVELLQLSYNAIKGANPDMIVVSGAMTPAGNVGDLAMDDIEYLQQMYANGAKGYFDALGAHPSGYNCPAGGDWRTIKDPTAMSFRGPFENRHHSWCFRGTMEGYRQVMLNNGDGAKAIVPTEFGWAVSANPRPGYEYARDNTPEEQAQWIVQSYQLAKDWGWVGPMFLWNLDYGVTAPGSELSAFGIINTPAFGALANMPKIVKLDSRLKHAGMTAIVTDFRYSGA